MKDRNRYFENVIKGTKTEGGEEKKDRIVQQTEREIKRLMDMAHPLFDGFINSLRRHAHVCLSAVCD